MVSGFETIEQAEELWKLDEIFKKRGIKERVKVNDMNYIDFYLARHKMHPQFGMSIMKKQGVLDYINRNNWKNKDMIIELANFPYDNNKRINN